MFALPEHYFDPAAPIAYDHTTRSWPLSAYDDVFRLLTDRENFATTPVTPTPTHLDAAALQQLEPAVRQHATQLIEQLPHHRFDLAPLARHLAEHVAQLVAPDTADPDTATAGIGNGLLFLTHYGQLQHATAETHRLAHAIDEVLRWYPPTPLITRTATHDVTFGQVRIPAGATLTGRISAANRDPKRFPDPNTFDITREPNRHLSFGRGAHYSPSAALTRVQMAVMLQEAAHRLPGLHWDTTEPLHRHRGPVHYLTRAIFTLQPADT